ncbi:MAG: RNA polymerase sigma-70 factor [Bacteroidales bacterium]|nr:RNA polymerase sigma-70 factor [Bacteroidales bacterium]MDD4670372.1 RNA polymerase sigma-70 factor [Bacteroidales bacterium]
MQVRNDLLDRLKSGDEQAFKILFYEYYGELVIYAYSFLGNKSQSEDLVQDFFIGFWQNRKFMSVNSSLDSYLFISIKNMSLNVLRREKFKSRNLSDMDFDCPAESEDDVTNEDYKQFDYSKLYEAIHKLPEARRKIFTMCIIDNQKYKDVAERLNISVNTVKVQMSRAFKFIKENCLFFL